MIRTKSRISAYEFADKRLQPVQCVDTQDLVDKILQVWGEKRRVIVKKEKTSGRPTYQMAFVVGNCVQFV